MPRRQVTVSGIPEELAAGIRRLQTKLELPQEFPAAALTQAADLAANPPSFSQHTDLSDIEFVTIDPPSSLDLDQALHLSRVEGGYLVRYAIADVGAWIEPGSPLDLEANRRGETMYAPAARVSLHPPALSEGAASLLADGKARPALVWEHRLDGAGRVLETSLQRALIRNYAKLSYSEVQAQLDAKTASQTLQLLAEFGELRRRQEIERGGISLNLPDQEIVTDGGGWRLELRRPLPVENWNAQLSLLTGIAAAKLMLEARVGILRTLPPAEDYAIERLRRSARSLGVEWPKGQRYSDFVRSLRPDDPAELAVMMKCTLLFRGAGYLVLDGELPDENLEHGALATPYAHTTAPLRRLVDRYVLETCYSLANGLEVPAWVRQELPELPGRMEDSGRKANAYERGVIDLAEALLLRDRVGEIFDAALIDIHPKTKQGIIQLAELAVEARLPSEGRELGNLVRVRLDHVDLASGELRFSYPN